jgi:hypothetical protein
MQMRIPLVAAPATVVVALALIAAPSDVAVAAGPQGNATMTAAADAAGKVPVVTSISPASGNADGGTAVTITGSLLNTLDATGNSAIMFGDMPARKVEVVSATKVTAYAPGGANGSVVVTANNSVGSSIGQVTFTYRGALGVTFADGVTAKPTGGTVIPVQVTGGSVGDSARSFAAEKITAKVGSAAATVAWVDSTDLKITAPATTNASAVAITLFHDGVPGPPSTEMVDYTPVVASVQPTKINAVGGDTVTITGTGFGGVDADDASSVTFGGTDATSFTVASPTKITAVAPPGTDGAAQVSVRTSGGASADVASARVIYRMPLGMVVPDGTVAKTGGGTVVTFEVTDGTIGDTAKDFAAQGIALLAGKTKLAATWVDSTHLKATVPATDGDYVDLTLVHDGIGGAPLRINYVPVITSMTPASGPVGGGTKVTIKVAAAGGADPSSFVFGTVPATCTQQGAGKSASYVCVVPQADQAGPAWVSFTSANGVASGFTAAAGYAYTDLG